MTRYKAFVLHLLSSIFVLSLIFFLIQQIWYPGQLFTLGAGSDLLLLIAGVDLVIGPFILLLIFDAKKKYIKTDVIIILLCQLGFMGYGCWIMFTTRPAYFSFVDERFYLVRADEIDNKDLTSVKDPQFRQIPLSGPVAVGTKEPDDAKIKNDIALSAFGGMGIQNLPQYFVPYSQVWQQVVAAGKTSQELKVDQNTKKRVIAYEENHPNRDVLFLPMVNKRTPLIVVIDSKTAQIIQII